jgi:hypothetical protein
MFMLATIKAMMVVAPPADKKTPKKGWQPQRSLA